jgi:DNA-directed RNA polymerase subunit RPC12/RpoP
MIEAKCPACGQTMMIHIESVSVGMEILCRECGSILAVDKVEPLVLTEIDLDD